MPVAALPETVVLPGLSEPFSLELPRSLLALREEALKVQQTPCPGQPELRLSDAAEWAAHTPEEDWLLWRARRCAGRLRHMRLSVEPGELIIGKPDFRPPTPEELEPLQAADEVLKDVPPFPGGDPGHFHPNFEKLFRVGIGGLLAEIEQLRAGLPTEDERQSLYAACRVVTEALSDFVLRAAEACGRLAREDSSDAGRWRELEAICRHIATEPPATFHEAIQLMFLTQIALWFAEDHHLTTPGRMDQTLRRFYEADVAAGRLDARRAFELISCLCIHMNRILWPGSAVSVLVGGLDAEGRDVTNTLTYLCLAARQATHLVYPTVGLVWHPQSPDELLDYAVRMIATGVGDPAIFNDEVISAGLRDHGVAPEDCRNYMNSTCVEIKVCGASNMWVTQPYFNCAQALLEVMQEASLGVTSQPESFGALCELVRARLSQRLRDAADHLDRVWHERETRGCFPLASCLVDDCLTRGRDFDRGGARYNWVENSFVGLANLVDGLGAIRELVYSSGELTLADLTRILEADWEGHEILRQRILNTLPKYGNDDPQADELAAEWSQFLVQATEACHVGLHRYVPGFFCWIQHERMGSQTNATPDGRRAGLPLADGAGAAQGREKAGPTASALSTTCWSHRPILGGLVHNAKFSRNLLRSPEAQKALRGVIETYMQRGGFEIQVNVVGRETLLEAQEHPELHPDLLVRVAGYSDYFVHLNRNMQDEVIARTEHELA